MSAKNWPPYELLDDRVEAAEARTRKLARIYHVSQEQAWDGRALLAQLIERHGGVHVKPEQQEALGKILSILLWGELAAWSISAELAEKLDDVDAKMAATSQVFDEARHFYVLRDYVRAAGIELPKLGGLSKKLLTEMLDTHDLARKLIGMQLLVENIALVLFKQIGDAKIEPVLTDLLPYYEKDEARHVGLGIQHLPSMMKAASAFEHAGAIGFQLRLVFWSMASLKALEPDLRVLGIEARQIMRLGKAKQLHASEMLWSEMGIERPALNRQIGAGIDAINELVFPRKQDDGSGTGWLGRMKLAREVFKAGGLPVDATTLDMPAPAIAVA